jgi:hypothetical protein
MTRIASHAPNDVIFFSKVKLPQSGQWTPENLERALSYAWAHHHLETFEQFGGAAFAVLQARNRFEPDCRSLGVYVE